MNNSIENFNTIPKPIICFNHSDATFHGNKSFDSLFHSTIEKEGEIIQKLNLHITTSSYNSKHETITIEGTHYILIFLFADFSADLYFFLLEPTNSFNPLIKSTPLYKSMNTEFLGILRSLHDDFTVVDGDGTLITALPSFESFYGIASKKVIGKTVFELEEEGIFSPSIAVKVFRTNKPATALQYTATGKYLMCTAIPIFTEDGHLEKIISFSRDVTQYEHLKAEYEKLKEANAYNSLLLEQADINPYTNDHSDFSSVSKSQVTKNLTKLIQQISTYDATVLLTGESGVGKTFYAEKIHSQSSRKNGSFVDLNCAAIPESLFESELFGYSPGAFTGANSNGKIGLIEKANNGTLFLDEIGDMPPLMQVKLLKTLDSKKIIPIGSSTPKDVNFRLIAATNKPLEELIKSGDFREDLFYRLNVLSVRIPSLREHSEDIFPISMFLLKALEKKHSIKKDFSSKSIDLLSRYPWPGNIRELQNIIERVALTTKDFLITEQDLESCLPVTQMLNNINIENNSLHEILEAVEKEIILKTYNETNSMTQCAKKLGISQPSISLKLKKYLSQKD